MILTGENRPAGTNEINWQECPFCGDAKWHFYISDVTGGYQCKKCGAKGYQKVDWQPEEILGLGFDERHPDFSKVSEYEWREIELPAWNNLSDGHCHYLRTCRGLSKAAIKDSGLVSGSSGQRIIFPFYNNKGQIIYWTARASGANVSPKYKNVAGIKHPLYVPARSWHNSGAVIVEGPIDAIRVGMAGYNGIALGGKVLARHLEKSLLREIAGESFVAVMLDGDAVLEGSEITQWLRERTGLSVRQILLNAEEDPGCLMPHEIREKLQ